MLNALLSLIFVLLFLVPLTIILVKQLKRIFEDPAKADYRDKVQKAKDADARGWFEAKAFKQAFLETYGPDAYRAKFGVGPEQDGLPLW